MLKNIFVLLNTIIGDRMSWFVWVDIVRDITENKGDRNKKSIRRFGKWHSRHVIRWFFETGVIGLRHCNAGCLVNNE